MKKVDPLALIAGLVFVIGGAVLITLALFKLFFVIFHGVIVLIIGIVILLTLRKQDYVEPIKKELKRKK
tara:strand:+ start:4275 stop:4481 length:207 start_codon:yes stop_codon:yes gene_type:complete